MVAFVFMNPGSVISLMFPSHPSLPSLWECLEQVSIRSHRLKSLGPVMKCFTTWYSLLLAHYTQMKFLSLLKILLSKCSSKCKSLQFLRNKNSQEREGVWNPEWFTVRPLRIGWLEMIFLNLYSNNPNPKQKLIVSSQSLTVINIFRAQP